MGVLMLKCPQTGRESSTGIHFEEDSFKRLPDTVTKAACPHCGQLHRWWTRDARLSDATQPTRRAGTPPPLRTARAWLTWSGAGRTWSKTSPTSRRCDQARCRRTGLLIFRG